ncbi:TPA: hypothetical protein DEP86_00155 [Candidatus Uhrbacteria bacterium]|nr:hypothetical protein [Candidatus Uhrbacteria bacterium]
MRQIILQAVFVTVMMFGRPSTIEAEESSVEGTSITQIVVIEGDDAAAPSEVVVEEGTIETGEPEDVPAESIEPEEGQIDNQEVVITSESSVDLVVAPEGQEDQEDQEGENDESPEVWRPSTFISLGFQLSVSEDGTNPYLTLYFRRGLSPRVSLTAFALTNTCFSETYVGLLVQPLDWLNFGLSAGLESSDGLWRVAASLAIQHSWFSLNWTFEYGASGRWHLLTVNFRLSDVLSIGLISKRGDGEGVFLAIQSGRWFVRLSGHYDVERALDETNDSIGWDDTRFFTGLLTVGIDASDASTAPQSGDNGSGERQPVSTGTLHVFASASQDGFQPNVGLWLTRPISSRFGLWFFGVAAPGYGEAYGGLNVTPWPWITVGLAVGIETTEDIWRLAASLDLTYGRFSLSFLVEIGGADWCQFLTATYQATDNLALGLMSKRFNGEGAFLRVSMGRVNFTAAFLYDIERARHEVGDGVEWTDSQFLTGFLWLAADMW